MKKILLILLIIGSFIFLSSCKEEKVTEFYVKIKNNYILSGQEDIGKFFEKSKNNERCSITIDKTYTLDANNFSKEYYEQNKDNYPKEVKYIVTYDGNLYDLKIPCIDFLDKITSSIPKFHRTYKYLMVQKTLGNAISNYNYVYEYYFTNDLNETLEDYYNAMYSSSSSIIFPDVYPFISVYNYKNFRFYDNTLVSLDYINKDGLKRSINTNDYLNTQIFRYLDSLDWEIEIKSNLPSSNINESFELVTKRTLYTDNYNVFIGYNKGDEIEVSYIFNIKEGLVYMEYVSFSSLVRKIYAPIDNYDACKLLSMFGPTFGMLNNERTYVDTRYYVHLENNGRYTYGYNDNSVYPEEGIYYIIKDKLFLVSSDYVRILLISSNSLIDLKDGKKFNLKEN